MEPLEAIGLAAGVISIADHAARVSAILGRAISFRSEVLLKTTQLEIEIYTTILQEIGQTALSGTTTLPQSATLSLQLCELHLSNLEKTLPPLTGSNKESLRLSWMHEANPKVNKRITRDLKDYRRSVKILRDIVTDAVTQELLVKDAKKRNYGVYGRIEINNFIDITQSAEAIKQQTKVHAEELVKSLSSDDIIVDDIAINNFFTNRGGSEGIAPEDVLASLRRAAEGINVSPKPDRNSSNPFEFYAKILRTQDHCEEEASVCAKFDTGSEDNWISASIVARVGLQDQAESTPLEKFYTGADGSLFQPTGTISISWTRNAIKSWQTIFLILENAPFDMLLGRKFIIDEGLFVFADPVLVTDLTRLAPLSKEDYHQMEQNLRGKGIQNEELSKTRQAKDAAARQRRRAEKAASRMSLASSRISLTTTPGSVTPPLIPMESPIESQTASTHIGAADKDSS